MADTRGHSHVLTSCKPIDPPIATIFPPLVLFHLCLSMVQLMTSYFIVVSMCTFLCFKKPDLADCLLRKQVDFCVACA